MAQILVVDDSPVVVNELTTFFTNEGFEVIEASDGVEGLRQIKAHPEVQLMMVDVNMPNMDGLTMVEKIRNEVGNNTVQILMLTTEGSPSMKARAKKSGVKGWIVKPFNGPAILGIVRKLVK